MCPCSATCSQRLKQWSRSVVLCRMDNDAAAGFSVSISIRCRLASLMTASPREVMIANNTSHAPHSFREFDVGYWRPARDSVCTTTWSSVCPEAHLQRLVYRVSQKAVDCSFFRNMVSSVSNKARIPSRRDLLSTMATVKSNLLAQL